MILINYPQHLQSLNLLTFTAKKIILPRSLSTKIRGWELSKILDKYLSFNYIVKSGKLEKCYESIKIYQQLPNKLPNDF